MARRLIYISDGTLSSLMPGEETNAGRLFRLLEEVGQRPSQLFDYDRGVQGRGWQKWLNAASGFGINLSILRGYAFLSTRWHPGDEIFLFGYSRGAYAVRSLAGMVGKIGLIRPGHRGERRMREAFRLYSGGRHNESTEFSREHCVSGVRVKMIGVWDAVRALGLPVPILSYIAPAATDFHDHALAGHIEHGYHALAVDEDRRAFEPILWEQSPDWNGRLEQAWFPGAHADVGGDLRHLEAARPLANIPLNWILRHAATHGLDLPENWESRSPEDPEAPMQGCRRGIARAFLMRRPRRVGSGDGTVLHLSIAERRKRTPSYAPRGHLGAGFEHVSKEEIA